MTRPGAILIGVTLAGCFSEPEKIETTSADAGSVTEGSEASGSTAADSTTGSVPDTNPYGPCVVATDCPMANSSCLFDTCVPPCSLAIECPPAPPPVAAAECMLMRCTLPCLPDASPPLCPPDTMCAAVEIGVGDQRASCLYDPP